MIVKIVCSYILVGLLLGTFSGAAMALPTADEVLEALPISDFKRDEIRSGEIVRWTTEEGSKRELADLATGLRCYYRRAYSCRLFTLRPRSRDLPT